MVAVSRGLVLAIALVGYLVALYEPPTVFGIVIFATSVLGSAFLPAYVCAVWWKKANTPGALSSMVIGASVAFVWEYGGYVETTQLAPMFAGVVSSTTAMIVVSLATRKLAPVPEYIAGVMDEAATVGPIPASLLAGADITMSPEAAAIDNAIRETQRDG
jgi:sodium/proline symporter